MLRAIGSAINRGVKETAVLTATSVASTVVGVVAYELGSSVYDFFGRQVDEFSSKDLPPEASENNVAEP